MTEASARRLARSPLVAAVEENARIEASNSRTLELRQWNLDRIDQSAPVVNSSGVYVGNNRFDYTYDGAGRHIYIVDSGVQRTHPEFSSGQVLDGPQFSTDGYSAWNPCGGVPLNANDFSTHGTAVASVAAGQTLGVAPGASIVPIKVVNCNGYNELIWLIWGINWIATPPAVWIQDGNPYPKAGTVANISLFAWSWQNDIGTLEWAIQQVVAAGVTVVVSANNQAADACSTSPARLAYGSYAQSGEPWQTAPHRVISVGGTGPRDEPWNCGADCWPDNPGSNTGRCVDMYAPASDLKVAHFGGTLYRAPGAPSSGTSFAAPQVAGYAARILQASPSLTPAQVRDQIRTDATALLGNFDGDGIAENDRLLYAWPSK